MTEKREDEDLRKDRSQAELASCSIVPGQIYRHYKGGLYVIVSVSIDEGTLEPLVTYRSNKKGTCWTRTLDNFTEKVCNSAVTSLNEPFVPRFILI